METLRAHVSMWVLCAGLLAGCAPDPHEPEGALGLLAEGCAAQDAKALFPALDERARHSLDAISTARKAARGVIEASYPAEERAAALAQLGDAAGAASGAELFALRCDATCVRQLCQGVGAPAERRREGELTHVKTVRGAQLTLYRAKDRRYGVVWHSEELMRERRRAFAELSSMEANGAVYKTQRALQ